MKTEKEILELRKEYCGKVTESQINHLTDILLYNTILSDQKNDQGG